MARIRTIKPELASDAGLARVSLGARYTFVLLITQADDYGLVPGTTRQLLGALYPHDETVTNRDIEQWIAELGAAGFVRLRQLKDGSPVLELANWAKHQRIDNAARSQLKQDLAEDEGEQEAATPEVADSRGEPPRAAAEIRSRALDLGPRTKDQGPTTKEQEGRAARAAAPPEQHWAGGSAEINALCGAMADWLGMRGEDMHPSTRKAVKSAVNALYFEHPELTPEFITGCEERWFDEHWAGKDETKSLSQRRPTNAKQAQDFVAEVIAAGGIVAGVRGSRYVTPGVEH